MSTKSAKLTSEEGLQRVADILSSDKNESWLLIAKSINSGDPYSVVLGVTPDFINKHGGEVVAIGMVIEFLTLSLLADGLSKEKIKDLINQSVDTISKGVLTEDGNNGSSLQ